MKRNLTVLVLLVMWSFLSIASLSSAATTGEIPEKQGSSEVGPQNDVVIHVNGAVDDGDEGDPGDMGDGYGISDQPDSGGNLGGFHGADNSMMEELMLLLTSLIQLAL